MARVGQLQQRSPAGRRRADGDGVGLEQDLRTEEGGDLDQGAGRRAAVFTNSSPTWRWVGRLAMSSGPFETDARSLSPFRP